MIIDFKDTLHFLYSEISFRGDTKRGGDSDLIAIQDIDENWPTEDYTSELKAYKRYAFQQNQKLAAAHVDSLKVHPSVLVKKDSTAKN